MINTTPRTVIDLWFPRYSDKFTDKKEYVFLPAKFRVDQATEYIIVTFSKAKHFLDQKFEIKRSVVEEHPLVSNGSIKCYAVPMSKFRALPPEVKQEVDLSKQDMPEAVRDVFFREPTKLPSVEQTKLI